MTIESYFQTINTEEVYIKKLIHNNIKSRLHKSVDSEVIEDLYSEVMTATAEKISQDRLTLETRQDIINYLAKAGWYLYKQQQKEQKRITEIDSYSYTQEYYTEEPEEVPQQTDIIKVYEYLDSKYSFMEVGIYKTWALNGLTYDQLSQVTGYKYSRCYNIIRRIQEDLKKNKKKLSLT